MSIWVARTLLLSWTTVKKIIRKVRLTDYPPVVVF